MKRSCLLSGFALLVPLPVFAQPVAENASNYGRVEVLRDEWGVPHVLAETDAGAMYGLGYVTAEDRGFQMHFKSRIMQGRLAELIGDVPKVNKPRETTVTSDRVMRTFGFYLAAQRVAANLDADTRRLLTAYCDGVNEYFARHRHDLHDLYGKVGLVPEPWTPADCIVAWWHVAQFFGTDGTRDLMSYRNLTMPAAERDAQAGGRGLVARGRVAAQIPPDDAVAVIQREDVSDEWISRVEDYMKQRGLPTSAPQDNAAEGPKFSHAWVVGGQLSTTGSAVLVSDPQTPVTNPSLLYEFHISGETFNARGVGAPGSPLILIGFSEHVAWGATALGADQSDLFRLKTDAARPDHYEVDGQWQGMEIRHETIRIKDGPEQVLTIRETRFGPLITEFAFAQPGDAEVAVKRVPICETERDTIQGALAMMRARDVRCFAQALEGWRFPSVNFVFGDRHGDIGYCAAAALPLRSPRALDSGSAAHDGSRSDADWQGFVPHDLLPHVINPRRGYLYSGNHRPIGAFYRIPLAASTGSMGDTIRSWRLGELLRSRKQFSPQDVLAIHYDTVNPSLRDIVRLGYHLRDRAQTEPSNLSPDTLSVLEYLESWRDAGSRSDLTVPGAEVVARIDTLFRIMSTELALKYGGGQSGLSRFLRDAVSRIAKTPPGDLTREESAYIDRVLADAWRWTEADLGPDRQGWPDGARRRVSRELLAYFQGLDGFPTLDAALAVPVPALRCVDGNTILSQRAQSYTQFVPMHDPDQAMTLLPVGVSENPASPYHANLAHMWAEGELHPAPLSPSAVKKLAGDRRILSGP